MLKRIVVKTIAGCLLTTSLTIAADNCFPSMHPPGGLNPQEVPMFIVLGWDDNAYSGEDEAIYYSGGDWTNGGIEKKTSVYPEGLPSQKVLAMGGSRTPIVGETKYGVKWVEYLNSTYNVKGSFYFIAGQGEDKEGYDGLKFMHPDGKSGMVPVVWGREHGIINESMKRLKAAGNEVGNHTLDHMEINVTSSKGLPESYLKFGSENCYGTTGEHKGWMDKAGKKISKEAWNAVLERAETSLEKIGLTENIGFRAPRLEINDNGLHALKERGYLYDCSYEEGSQPNFTAARSLWPYTSNNGSPSNAFSGEWGKPGTNYPEGLWMMNTPHLEIPETIIDGVISNWRNSSMATDPEYISAIESDRKVIAYDFNTLVMMGMTKEYFVEMLKYNFDQRYQSNRAPLLLGLHCDYFSPMYDEETLLSDKEYKDVLKYNNHQDRKDAIEEFLAYVTSKQNVKVVTMQELVQWMKDNNNEEVPSLKSEAAISLGDWDVSNVNNATVDLTANDDAIDITWNLGKCSNHVDWSDWPEAAVGAYNFNPMPGITHFEIEYASEKPFYFCIETGEGDDARSFKTLIGHADYSTPRLSGPIPVRDLEPDYYDETGWLQDWDQNFQGLELDPATITGVAFSHGAKGCENASMTYKTKITKIIAYGAEFTSGGTPVSKSIVNTVTPLKIGQLNSKGLNFTAPGSGQYRVSLFSLNGKLVQDVTVDVNKAGAALASFGSANLANSVFVVKITDLYTGQYIATKQQMH